MRSRDDEDAICDRLVSAADPFLWGFLYPIFTDPHQYRAASKCDKENQGYRQKRPLVHDAEDSGAQRGEEEPNALYHRLTATFLVYRELVNGAD